jgi:hypothetical protein
MDGVQITQNALLQSDFTTQDFLFCLFNSTLKRVVTIFIDDRGIYDYCDNVRNECTSISIFDRWLLCHCPAFGLKPVR